MRRYLPHVLTFVLVFAAVVGYGELCEWQQARAAQVLDYATLTEVSDMGMWYVSDAGDASYNGLYMEAGTHNGQPFYVGPSPANDRYLWYNVGGYWQLTPHPTDPEGYQATTPGPLPGNPWESTADGAASPGPTVAEPSGAGDIDVSTPRGVRLSALSGSYFAVSSITAGMTNIGDEAADVQLLWYSATAPYTLIDSWTASLPGDSDNVELVFETGVLYNVEGYFLLWADSVLVGASASLNAEEECFAPLNWTASWPTPQAHILLERRDEDAPDIVLDPQVVDPWQRHAAYSVLLAVAPAERASAYTIHEHVEATFASTYGTMSVPHVYGRSGYSILAPVTAEFASGYGVLGAQATRTFPSAYSTAQAVVAARESAYTLEDSGASAGPLMLLAALIDD